MARPALNMKNYKQSNTIAQACLIAAMLICAVQCAISQQVEWKPKPYKLGWNNYGYFKQAPKEKFLNWQDYPLTWDGKQFATWGAFALSGIAAGVREAYHADPYIFERRWGAGETSFWGSDAWKRNYVGNDPENPHKHELLGNVGRDVWHTAHFVDTWCLVGGTFTIGLRKQPIKYRVANMALGMAARWLFQNITYETLRS